MVSVIILLYTCFTYYYNVRCKNWQLYDSLHLSTPCQNWHEANVVKWMTILNIITVPLRQTTRNPRTVAADTRPSPPAHHTASRLPPPLTPRHAASSSRLASDSSTMIMTTVIYVLSHYIFFANVGGCAYLCHRAESSWTIETMMTFDSRVHMAPDTSGGCQAWGQWRLHRSAVVARAFCHPGSAAGTIRDVSVCLLHTTVKARLP